MQNNYILTNKDNEILSFYYGEERAIYCEKIGADNYPIKTKVIQDVTDCFTVDINPNKDIYIFCQNYNGDIILCILEQNTFRHKVLFRDKSVNPKNMLFYPIFFKGNMSLVYNTPVENNNFLAIKTLVGGKNWTNAENIDDFCFLQNNMFYMQKISEDNLIIAYQKKYQDIQIGYKEIKNGNISDFVTIHKTGYQIVDYSFIYFKGTIHYLYIIKTLFSSQLIYKRKDENGISSPVILFEGQRIKSCSINIFNNNLYCSFIGNSTIYYCQSEDFGKTFLPMYKYRKPISQDTIKARFISSVNINGSSINEVYIDSRNTLNIYMLPEFLPSIFNKNMGKRQDSYNIENTNKNKFITSLNSQFIEDIELEKENVEPNTNAKINIYQNREQDISKSTNQMQKATPLENDFMANFNLEEFEQFNMQKENINNIGRNVALNRAMDNDLILENKVKMLNEELKGKNSQILKLNDIIQNKNKNQTDIEINLRQKIRNMEDENHNLLKKIDDLKKEMENIKNRNKPIESEGIKNNEQSTPKFEGENKENREE